VLEPRCEDSRHLLQILASDSQLIAHGAGGTPMADPFDHTGFGKGTEVPAHRRLRRRPRQPAKIGKGPRTLDEGA
jgi:hypothetical protein